MKLGALLPVYKITTETWRSPALKRDSARSKARVWLKDGLTERGVFCDALGPLALR